MSARFVAFALIAILAAVPIAAAQPASDQDPAAMVAAVMTSGQVIVASVPLSSGNWGTDYITVSHALAVGRQYAVLAGNPPAAASRPVMACSSLAHGIDVLILRVASHANRRVIEWGDSGELRAGDELLIYARKEFAQEPSKVKFVHVNYLEWSKRNRDQLSHQWHNVMVAEGFTRSGFSGSPWFRNGRVFGLHKGSARRDGDVANYALAETASRVKLCLAQQHYEELVPKE